MATPRNAIENIIDAPSLVIPGEDPAELDALAREYFGEYQPATPTERHYVQRLVTCDWLRARYLRIQSDLLAWLAAQEASDPAARGRQYVETARNGDPLAKLFRQMDANDRTYDRALAALRQARVEKEAAQAHAATAAAATAIAPPASLRPPAAIGYQPSATMLHSTLPAFPNRKKADG